MLTSVFAHMVGQRLRATVMFALGVVAVVAMYVSVFPSFQSEMVGYADAMPEALASFLGSEFADPAGYLHSTIFTVLGPVLLVAAAVTFGSAAIAGEEEQHSLPLVLSAPVTRVRFALEKAAAVTAALTALAVVLFASVTLLVAAFGIEVTAGRLLAATLHLHALTLFAAGLAFGVGAATGRRALALATGAGAVVLGFVMNGVGGMVDRLDVLQWLSPFYWYSGTTPIEHGVAWGWLVLLYALAVAAAALGMWRFERRDLS